MLLIYFVFIWHGSLHQLPCSAHEYQLCKSLHDNDEHTVESDPELQKTKRTRLSPKQAKSKIKHLESLEILDLTKEETKWVELDKKLGEQILKLVSKCPRVNKEGIEKDGRGADFIGPANQIVKYSFGKNTFLMLSFYDDKTMWAFHDKGGDHRDVGKALDEINALLSKYNVQIPGKNQDYSLPVNFELKRWKSEIVNWTPIDLELGKKVLDTIYTCPIVDEKDLKSQKKPEKKQVYSLRVEFKEFVAIIEIYDQVSWVYFEDEKDVADIVKSKSKYQSIVKMLEK